ncbi:MAG: ketopantoate reductase family protein [Anaerolineaceae bacterium]|nr:ketopantoate reductase family protein [Anaerolineaceae bacterium]
MSEQTFPQLRVLCFGAGAIGSYIGGSLTLAGHCVVFLERPEMAEYFSKQGLSIDAHGQKNEIADLQVVGSIDEALTKGPYDVAILAVKSYDTAGLLTTLKPYAAALPAVVCFQNGVENEQKIAEVLGMPKVIYGSVTTAVGKPQPCEIQVEKLRGMGVSSNHSITPALVSALNSANLKAAQIFHADGMKWSKMLTNIMSNATSAILQMPPGDVFAHPGLYHLEVKQIREALAVMKHANIPLVDLPGVPVKLLMGVMKNLPEMISRPIVAGSVGKGRGDKMPSFYIDLAAGRPNSEVNYLNGAIVRYGERYNVPVPVNRALNRILTEIVEGKRNWQDYDHKPEKLLGEIKAATI